MSQSNRSGFETSCSLTMMMSQFVSQSNRSGFETRLRDATTLFLRQSQSNRSGFETEFTEPYLIPCGSLNPTVVVLKPLSPYDFRLVS